MFSVFGTARAQRGHLFADARAHRLPLHGHEGLGIWCASRRPHPGGFVWPTEALPDVAPPNLTRDQIQAQIQALVIGLPWQSIEQMKLMPRMKTPAHPGLELKRASTDSSVTVEFAQCFHAATCGI